MINKKIAIVGGGIIGLALGYKLVKKYPNSQITIFEKESSFGLHQSGRNSGVLHCGLHYTPGSLKAKLAVDGIRQMVNFCKNEKVDHDICGKIVVATNENQIKYLDNLANRGKKNEPSFIDFTAQKLADIKNITKSEIIDLTTSNFNKLFFN